MTSSHFALMSIYALEISAFFAILWRRDRRGQVRLFWQLFVGLMGGGLLLAWMMYFLPLGPPS